MQLIFTNTTLPPLAEHWRNLSFDKWWLSERLGIAGDGLHLHAGLLLLMVSGWALRRPPWSWRPWLIVAIVETLNEAYDMLQRSYPSVESSFRASSHDWWMTMAWPTIVLFAFPRLIRRYRPAE